ncbi:MAG TPA: hypothetical protein DEV93_10535 [Chloroflexi bacterium]|nr:hypothetical protein [Chloroflexota bacterium]
MEALPLQGVRVIDLAHGTFGLCGRILADLGCDVIKIEGTEDPTRTTPAANTAPLPQRPVESLCYDANKRIAEVASPEGRSRLFHDLLPRADIVIESDMPSAPAGVELTYETLRASHPGLIVVSITGFGRYGPYSAFKAPDLICQAMGGLTHDYGRPDRPPLAFGDEQGYQAAAISGATASLLALAAREKSGTGQHVDIGAMDVLATISHRLINYAAFSLIQSRADSRTPKFGACPSGVFKTKDGYVYTIIIAPRHWEVFYRWLGSPEMFRDEMWRNRHFRVQNHDVLDPIVDEFFLSMTTREVCEKAKQDGLLMAPLNTVADFLNDEQVRFREYVQTCPAGDDGVVRLLGSPIVINGKRCPVRQSPRKVRGPGWKRDPSAGNERSSAVGQPPLPNGTPSAPKPLPLDGVRVVDLTMVVAGPTLTRVLGEFGAEVWRFESAAHPQRGRGGEGLHPQIQKQQHLEYADLNRNKKQVACNVNAPEGRELLRQVIAQSDVVVTGLTPKVLDRWGLTYGELRRIRPDIILACLTGQGLDGPRREEPGLAITVGAQCGLYRLWNYPDQDPPVASVIVHPDYALGHYGAIAILALLLNRSRTGKGGVIDLSHTEVSSSLIAPTMARYLASGRVPDPSDVLTPQYAPHNCYRCIGHDRWCVIAVETDDEWRNLCGALGDPSWARDASFANREERAKHHEDLDRYIGGWTSQHTPHQVMSILQRAGVAAGVVASPEDLYLDPHLRERGMIVRCKDPLFGLTEFAGTPLKLSDTPGTVGECGPIGGHNDELFKNLLAVPSPRIDQLTRDGILS